MSSEPKASEHDFNAIRLEASHTGALGGLEFGENGLGFFCGLVLGFTLERRNPILKTFSEVELYTFWALAL